MSRRRAFCRVTTLKREESEGSILSVELGKSKSGEKMIGDYFSRGKKKRGRSTSKRSRTRKEGNLTPQM